MGIILGAIIGLCCCCCFGKLAYGKFNEEEDDSGAPVIMVQHMRSPPSEDGLSIATTGDAMPAHASSRTRTKNPGGPGSLMTSPRPGRRPGHTGARRTKKDNV